MENFIFCEVLVLTRKTSKYFVLVKIKIVLLVETEGNAKGFKI